jgi:predicted transcriptional regulator
VIILFKNLEVFDKKILVLYILDIAKKSLTVDQIVSFCCEFDDITYFDICEYIQNLKINNYIEEYSEDDTTLYRLTDTGTLILHELLELIPGVNLYNLKKILSKNIVSVKTEYSIGSTAIPVKSDEYKISCYIKDGNDEIVNVTMYAGNKDHVKQISKNWQENSENIYAELLKMMTKE